MMRLLSSSGAFNVIRLPSLSRSGTVRRRASALAGSNCLSFSPSRLLSLSSTCVRTSCSCSAPPSGVIAYPLHLEPLRLLSRRALPHAAAAGIRRGFHSGLYEGRMRLKALCTLLAATTVFSSTALAALYSSSGAGPMHALGPSALYFGHALIPHPDKIHRGGEDAYFVSHALQAFGVADGVGAWSTKGIDPGKFSRSIMQFVEHAILKEKADKRLTPVQAMRASFDRVVSRGLQGSCTALVARLRGRVLHVANLGDSGIIILRPNKVVGEDAFPYDSMCRRKQTSALLQAPGGLNPYGLGNKPDKKIDSKISFRVIYRSKEQQHYFNCPFQLDLNGNDPPEKADVSSHELVEGDVVIAGSDGLFDNLFDSDIAMLASLSSDPQELSYILATQAQHQANHSKGSRATPFAVNAMEAGWKTSGGKLDDIAVIVGMFAKAPVDEKPLLSKL